MIFLWIFNNIIYNTNCDNILFYQRNTNSQARFLIDSILRRYEEEVAKILRIILEEKKIYFNVYLSCNAVCTI